MPTRQQSALGRLLLAGLAVLTVVAGWARAIPMRNEKQHRVESPFSTLPAHFAPPEKTRWGRGARAPYPTGAYWLNAALGDVPVRRHRIKLITPKARSSPTGSSGGARRPRRSRPVRSGLVRPARLRWWRRDDRRCRRRSARVKHVENEAGGFVAAGDALYGASNRTQERDFRKAFCVRCDGGLRRCWCGLVQGLSPDSGRGR